MNERIQALVAQASYKIIETNEAPIITQEFDKELFAQLIVRECLKIVEPTEDSGDEWCVTLKGTAQEIREHFGVAE
jgi:hypothetical protein